MKLTRYIPAGISAGICTVVLAGAAITGAAVPAEAATAAPHASAGHSAAEAMTAWVNGPGYGYLNATESALAARNGRKLARCATLAAEHPQPVDIAGYVAMMREYAAAGRALTRGETRTANTDIAKADDMAWDVVEATFSALPRLPG